MATDEARRLTEAHRLAQARLGAGTVALMLSAWPLLDPDDLDGTVARWLRVVGPIVGAQRSTSARLAGSYLAAFRALELGPAPFTPTLAGPVAPDRLATSLTITGPVHVKAALARGARIRDALDLGAASSARSGMRHALDGGRSTVLDTLQADPARPRWVRVTSGNPCSFCSGLAGIEFKSNDAAVFQAHDGCACAAEPAY